MRSTAFKVTALLCAVVLAAVGLMLGSGYETARQSDSLRLTAAFYPVYVLALNVTEGVEGVTVDNLVASTTGCLHDYQLSPADLVSLRSSDALLLSGAGAERFLDPVRERYPDLPLIDSSVGIELLCASHAHEHTDDHDHHEGDAPNSHLW